MKNLETGSVPEGAKQGGKSKPIIQEGSGSQEREDLRAVVDRLSEEFNTLSQQSPHVDLSQERVEIQEQQQRASDLLAGSPTVTSFASIEGIPQRTITRLKAFDAQLHQDAGVGLEEWIRQQPTTSITAISKKVGVKIGSIKRLLDAYGITRLAPVEAARRALPAEWQGSAFEGMNPSTITRLSTFEARLRQDGDIGLDEWLRQQYPGKSLKEIAKDIGVRDTVVKKLFDVYGIPRLSVTEASRRTLEAKWQDPEFRKKTIAAGREANERYWQDPINRVKQGERSRELITRLRQDPEFETRRAEGVQRSWQDPVRRARHNERVKALWEDPDFRERQAAGASEASKRMFEDDEFVRRFREGARKNWEDPDFRERQAESARRSLAERRQDPEFIQKMLAGIRARREDPEYAAKVAELSSQRLKKLWKDPNFRARTIERTKQRWQDPEFREKYLQAMRHLWEDEDFRERQAAGASEGARNLWDDEEYRERKTREVRENWQNPEFRERHAEGMRRAYEDEEFREQQSERSRETLATLKQDPEFQRKQAEATRRARANPELMGRYTLPTIDGERRDVGYAQSTWEANFARVLRYCGREYDAHVPYTLIVPKQYQQELGLPEVTQKAVDFITQDPRGNVIVYEIMAHPLEDPVGLAKFELLTEQYPDMIVRPITRRVYRSLQRHFAKRIDSDSRFSGWETRNDNLDTDPEKYAVKK